MSHRAVVRRDLVLVSSGLQLDGGGRATVGRLLARGCGQFAAERGIELRILSLGDADGYLPPAPTEYFGQRSLSLAARIFGLQLRGSTRAFVFDLLGPARVQAYVPGSARSPFLVVLLGIEAWRRLDSARRRTLGAAAVRLAISDFTAKRALEANPGLGPIDIVPLCLEPDPVPGEVDPTILDQIGEDYLLIVGRMAASERYKGHDLLLDTLAELSRRGVAARLVVAGDGDDRPRLEAKAKALELDGRVTFIGFVEAPTLAEVYRRARAFVMPSREEGFGLVYLEAMRAAKPCVALRGSVAQLMVRHEVTGLLVEDRQESLAAALERLCSDPSGATRLGAEGRKIWQAEFPFERFRAVLDQHLEALTSARHVRD